jgi:hypothetical protein
MLLIMRDSNELLITETGISTPEMLASHVNEIEEILESYRGERVRNLMRVRDPSHPYYGLYDLAQRTLSEMPLCDMSRPILKKLRLPEKFSAKYGHVTLDHQKGLDLIGYEGEITHAFLTDGDVVIDFTAGQFGFSDGQPGSTIERFRTKSPDLVTVFPTGLAVVVGTKENLQRGLGISYSEEYSARARRFKTSDYLRPPIGK